MKIFWSVNKNGLTTFENIQKIAIGECDDDLTGCLLDYPYFKGGFKLIATGLSK